MDPAVAAWAGVGALSFISIGGWMLTWVRNGRNQARLFGKLEGKVDGLCIRMDNVEKGLSNVHKRIDSFINGESKGKS